MEKHEDQIPTIRELTELELEIVSGGVGHWYNGAYVQFPGPGCWQWNQVTGKYVSWNGNP